MSNEWYTPSKYIEAAREVMGTIDLDPASCALANETVKATHYYTIENDGLVQEWYGNVWLNPPYSKPKVWIEKFLREDIEGILLLPTFTDTSWFHLVWQCPICFLKGRIDFQGPERNNNYGNSRYGSCFIYTGHDAEKFREVFSQFGHVVMPEKVVVHV